MTDTPCVTVIAACYNHERFVEECLDSIRSQNYPNLQLIITDDASTDESAEIIERWIERTQAPADFIRHSVNAGFPATLNEARLLVSGELLTIIATDDVMEPGRLLAQAPNLAASELSVAAVYSDAWIIDEAGARTRRALAGKLGPSEGPPEGNIFPELLRQNFIPAPSVLVRCSCLDAVGDYDESLNFEDWDMWLRLARRFEFRYADSIGVRYRIVEGSMYRSRRQELAVAKIRMLEKWTSDPLYGQLAVARLRQEIHHLWDLDRKASLPHLQKLCLIQPGLPSRARYVLARLGVPYRLQQRLLRKVPTGRQS